MNTSKSPKAKLKLLDSAQHLFAHKGFHGTSLRDISSRAGVNVSLISRYFSGKQGLYEACFTRLYDQIQEHRSTLHALFAEAAFPVLVRHTYFFAQKNKPTLLLIQRGLMIENIGIELAGKILKDFTHTLHPFFPHLRVEDFRIGLQTLLILLTRYALMSPQEMKHITPHHSTETIINHLTDLATHIFSTRQS
jgi:AcrR family transcriptional regulator